MNTQTGLTVLAVIVVVLGGGYYFYAQQHPVDQVDSAEESSVPTEGKLDMNAVCQSALAYTTFPDASSSEAFVEECKEGKHPEVIERYKADMNLGDGAAV